ncbi:hypothetical protein ATE84_2855 [Aquimarina sp. MAR_2010_214]|uniref:hypothetical protein n=1 Tax=Aquimarina sp. MAR_2010_214 TaxID=1250026 RepID=UPI000C70026D|nr:hypothetical protein [Aquimarina sp. MAR_2010_214]PKV50788.1 hypothetical protein ATE84_2855 [Aquimarina sp. MAR_2010_214]
MKNKYLVFIALTMIACESMNIDVPDNPPETTSTDSTKICFNDYDIKPSTLEIELINEMTKGYMNHQLKRINNSGRNDNDCSYPSMNDSQTIWFDFKSLKAFLYYIEQKAKESNSLIETDNLGIRIYYASYPDKGSWSDFKDLSDSRIGMESVNYEKKHTLIFVPTIKDNGIDYDFNPLDSSNSKLEDLDNAGISVMGFTAGGRTSSRNHGSLWPPDNYIVSDNISRKSNGIRFPSE